MGRELDEIEWTRPARYITMMRVKAAYEERKEEVKAALAKDAAKLRKEHLADKRHGLGRVCKQAAGPTARPLLDLARDAHTGDGAEAGTITIAPPKTAGWRTSCSRGARDRS